MTGPEHPRTNVSCTYSSVSENRYGIDDALAPLTRHSTVPRTPAGALDVEVALRWVREGWVRDRSAWRLPGTGKPRPECGTWLACAIHCDSCQHRDPHFANCKSPTCPTCAPKWVRQGAMAKALTLEGHLATFPEGSGVAIRRAFITVDPARWDSFHGLARGFGVMKSARRTAIQIALEKGFLAGFIVFHPWRDKGTWAFDERGPHFHVLGLAQWLGQGDGEGGYNFIARPERYFRAWPVFDRLAYDLTHVGIAPRRPSVVAFGPKALTARTRLPAVLRDRIKSVESGLTWVCSNCGSTNTHTSPATWEDRAAWGLDNMDRLPPLAVQHRFRCDDCGATEPVPEKPVHLGPRERDWMERDRENWKYPHQYGDDWNP